MKRKELIAILDLLKPALADQPMVPVFCNYCFTQDTIYAYNDSLGIVAPFENPFDGKEFSVNGGTLLSLLKNSKASEVELEFEDESVLVKAGRSRMKLPFMDSEEFLFEEPEADEWPIELDLNMEILEGVSQCLVTSSTDHSQPALMGLTLNIGDGISLYSCDGDSISHFLIDGANDSDMKAVHTIPNSFWEALLRMAKSEAGTIVTLKVSDEWALAEFDTNYKIYGRVIENSEPMNHADMLEKTVKEDDLTFIPVPKGFNEALSRARVVADPESQPTVITIKDGKMRLVTETSIGNVKDTLNVEAPDVEARVNAALVQRSLGVCEEIAITENCTCYRKDIDLFQLVGNMGE